jgi:hypothetical protein
MKTHFHTLFRRMSGALALVMVTAIVAQPAVRRATIDLTIGRPDESRDDYIFGDVRGLALASDGRILVADNMRNAVSVFDAAGRFVYRFGRKGTGPADLDGPCCLAFDAKGRLWVREFGNKRLSVFSLGPSRAKYLWSVRGVVNPWGGLERTTRDSKGRVIDIGSTFNPATQSFGAIREVIDSAGTVISIDTLPEPPKASLSDRTISKTNADGSSGTTKYAQPFGPSSLRAFGPGGDLARAISSRYAVSWEDIRGRRRTLIQREGEGPLLSEKEKASVDRTIESISKNTRLPRTSLPFVVPARKPPLVAIGFDLDGRLWVQRSVVQGQPRVADVYDASGKLLMVAEWPANVSLGMWVVSGTTGIGIATDSVGTQSIVRLRFR